MKQLISILVYIPALIGFSILAFFVLLLTFICKPYSCDSFIKLLCRFFLKTSLIRVKVRGREKVDPQKTYIFMSNHVNIFDVFILTGYIPNLTRGVELDKHFHWPIWGPMIRRYGNIPISHTNPRSALVSLEKARETFKKGVSIIILPESHRTRDGNLLPFKKGPFRLAAEAQADIVPCAMVGAYEIKTVTSWLIKPGTVIFKIGDVVPYQFYKDLSITQVRDLVKNKIVELLEEKEKK